MRHRGQRVLDAERAAQLAVGFLAPFERFGRAVLEFGTQLIIESFDFSDLADIDIGNFFEAGEAFGDQQLRQRFVDIEFLLEQVRPLDEFALALFAGVGFGENVDGLAGQLTGEADVLATTTNGKRQLIIGHHDFDAVFLFVDHDAADVGGLQRIDDEGRGVFGPWNDVDLFALHFLNDGLNAAALHADAGTDGVDAAVAADHANLGAAAGIARSGHDRDDAVVNFGHFLRKQLFHEIRMRAGQENLRAPRFTNHFQDQRADTITDADHFARNLRIAADDAFGPAEINDHMAELDALDDTGDDFAAAVLEFLILPLALGIADFLEDDLLRCLRLNAAELDRWQRIDDIIADLGPRLKLLCRRDVYLLVKIVDQLDDFDNAPQPRLARLRINLGANLHFRPIAHFCRALDCVLERFDHDLAIDQLFLGNRIGNCQQFGLVGGNRSRHSSILLAKFYQRRPSKAARLLVSICRSEPVSPTRSRHRECALRRAWR